MTISISLSCVLPVTHDMWYNILKVSDLLPFPQSENYINVNYRNVPEDSEVGGPTVPLGQSAQ